MAYYKDKRYIVGVRLNDDLLFKINKKAIRDKVTQSEAIRSLIIGGLRNEPKNKKTINPGS